LETNPYFGSPAVVHAQRHTLALDLCGAFHTYTCEWTPDAIVWRVDNMEIRRETGATAQAFADNASAKGLSIHVNVWPGDESFGGNFSPAILPVHEYVDWVQYSKYENGAFNLSWREDFNGPGLPTGWLAGNWKSPKGLSTNTAANVNVLGGNAVLSLTTDEAQGPAGAMVGGASNAGGSAGSSTGGSSSGSGGAAGSSTGGTATGGTATGGTGTGGTGTSGAAGSSNGASGAATGGSSTTPTGGASAAGNSTTGGGLATAGTTGVPGFGGGVVGTVGGGGSVPPVPSPV